MEIHKFVLHLWLTPYVSVFLAVAFSCQGENQAQKGVRYKDVRTRRIIRWPLAGHSSFFALPAAAADNVGPKGDSDVYRFLFYGDFDFLSAAYASFSCSSTTSC